MVGAVLIFMNFIDSLIWCSIMLKHPGEFPMIERIYNSTLGVIVKLLIIPGLFLYSDYIHREYMFPIQVGLMLVYVISWVIVLTVITM